MACHCWGHQRILPVLFLIIALKFVIGSFDAEQRQNAKEWFKKAVFIIVTINVSLLAYSVILETASALTQFLWSTGFESLFESEAIILVDFLWAIILAVFIFLTTLTLILRQISLIAGVMLFPIGLFLYFIPPLQTYGSTILNIWALRFSCKYSMR